MWTLLFLALVTYLVYKFYIYPFYFSPLARLPGPPPGNIPLLGSLPEMRAEEFAVAEQRWAKQYGSVYRYYFLLNNIRVVVSDPLCVQHVLSRNVYLYQKNEAVKNVIRGMAGDGLLNAEGMEHKRQRKYLQKIFSYKYLRAQVPVIFEHFQELVGKWKQDAKKNEPMVMDHDLGKAALNVIGDIAFGYKFNAFHGDNELAKAYSILMDGIMNLSTIIGMVVPWTQTFIPHFWRAAKAKKVVDDTVEQVIQTRKQALASGDRSGKDLLSVLLMEQEDPEDGIQVSDKELRDQVLNMMLAGHETTTTAISWALHALALYPDVQTKLRQEIKQHFGEHVTCPTADTLDNLVYLDMVVKEVLRVYTIGLAGMRDATQDDTLPDGTFIPKGTEVIVFMKIMHNLEEYWGKDADQFNPDRWNDIHPEKIPNFIHVFMPFLCGARICIGQRLALMEFKMALMLLVSEFEFSQVAGHVVKGSVGVSNKPDPHILLNVKAL